MIKAVIFDCFGVLTGEGLVPFRERHFGHDAELLKTSKQLSWQMVLGKITFDEMLQKFAKTADMAYEDVVKEIEVLSHTKNEELLAFIRTSLKPIYKIGVLSNIPENRFEMIFDEEDDALFDAKALSWQIGHAKPEPEAYHIAAEMLGVSPHEAIFIDDRHAYLKGAERVGMATIKYESFPQFNADLNQLIAGMDREIGLTFSRKSDTI
ncbi:MAG TPA: HAD-IA family hydrolase [Candidatus Saccharimonadales bacterium]|nr:HAD-IA family hydrolase [Candidatus Saccharimonadales bacterium]